MLSGILLPTVRLADEEEDDPLPLVAVDPAEDEPDVDEDDFCFCTYDLMADSCAEVMLMLEVLALVPEDPLLEPEVLDELGDDVLGDVLEPEVLGAVLWA